jgi:tripeptide aminopeptidase
VIEGGKATNIVCPEVRLRIEARSRDSAKLAAQVQHILDAIHAAAAEFGAGIDVTINHNYDSYLHSESHPMIRMAQTAATEIGLETSLKAAGGGSDANVFNAIGIPACVLGTGMRNIHTHQECIAVTDLVKSAEWVVAITEAAARAGIEGMR